ncbi:MAG: PKD domain-containing protein [Bacteroidia bacterium]|nr:PKD domain-containing protein [Bacteroidia bacterium]
MKTKLFWISLFLLASLGMKAQPSTFSGTVVDSSGFQLLGTVVYLDVRGISNPSYTSFDSTSTDSSGTYAFTLNLPQADYSYKLFIINCDGNPLSESDSISAPANITKDFTFCAPGSNSCLANFFFFDQGNSQFRFQQISSGLGSQSTPSFSWDFGDGNSATGAIVNHTYANFGMYTVCMVLEDSASGCIDSICKIVDNSQFNPNNCFAQFAVQDNGGGNFTFRDSSNLPNDTIEYYFNFGDGSDTTIISPIPSQPSVSHFYASSGTYNVSLWVQSSGGCFDSTSYPVVYNGPGTNCNNVFFNLSLDTLSGAFLDFEYRAIGPFNGQFEYFWDFGDGNSTFGASGNHQFSQRGTYEICLFAMDTVNLCADTICKTLAISQDASNACDAIALIEQVNDATYFEALSRDDSSSNYSYYWDFGDGNSSTNSFAIHRYASNGTYNAFHVVNDGNCSDTVFFDVVFDFFSTNPSNNDISGRVMSPDSSIILNDGLVYLVRVDSTPQGLSLTAVDTTDIIAGAYNFMAVDTGVYLLKAALNPSSPNYTSHFPSYHFSVLTWDSANVILADGSQVTADIEMVVGTNPGGPGFIGGLVSQGANKRQGDPLENIQVNLLGNNGEPVAYTYTDVTGAYEFDRIALGSYEIHVEVTGLVAEDLSVVLDSLNPSSTENDFEVSETGVDIATNVEELLLFSQLNVFPNPASDRLNVQLELERPGQLHFLIRDIMGRSLLEKKEEGILGKNKNQLAIDGLQPAVYILEIRVGTTTQIWKFTKF